MSLADLVIRLDVVLQLIVSSVRVLVAVLVDLQLLDLLV
jgi:hypothetical protein